MKSIEVWVEWYDRHAERIADATGEYAAVLSKLEGGAARIALIVHCVRQAAGDPEIGPSIDESSIRAGIAIAEWYANETERVYQVLRGDDEDRRRLLSRLTRQYLFVSLFRACAESLASENASRIAAMQAAEKNIEERLDELHGSFNHLRQTTITEELLDVVTGFEALSNSR